MEVAFLNLIYELIEETIGSNLNCSSFKKFCFKFIKSLWKFFSAFLICKNVKIPEVNIINNIGTTNTCVTPVYMEGSVEEAMNLVYDLRENHNIFCSIVVYPVVPKGVILLRLIPTSVHTLEDVKVTLNAFDAVSDNLRSGVYAKMATSM